MVDLTSSARGFYVAAIFLWVGWTIFFYLFLRSPYIPTILMGELSTGLWPWYAVSGRVTV
ncbi:MAG: hypothetical protein M3082_01210 [Candidatus Dormibacteraeota bacterium]|nr:hypothetical protein [Candidatus Dormibacteraeota bacterium]